MRKYRKPNPALQAHAWRKHARQRAVDSHRLLAETRASERRFRQAVHLLPIAIGITDKQGRVLTHNQMFTEVFGYTLEDIPTVADWVKLAYPDETYRQQSLNTWLADVELALARGATTPPRIYQVVCKDGSRRLVEITTQAFGDLLATTFNDVTARKQAEESLRVFKALVENSSDAIGMSTPDGKHYYQNEAFSHLFGEIGEYPPDTLYVDREIGRQVFETIMAGGQWIGEVEMYARDKKILNIWLRAYANTDDAGNIIGLVGIHTNITERKRMEDALRENEVIFSSFLEHSPVYVFFKDKNIRSLRLSRNYEQMLGMPISAALGKTMDELFPSDLAKSMVADDLRILNEGQRVQVVEEFNRRVYETTKFPIFKDGKPEMLAGFTLDITDRVRAEQALRENNQFVNSLLRAIPIAVFFKDREGRYLGCNDVFTGITGVSAETLRGKTVYELWPGELAEVYHRKDLELMQNKEHQTYEFKLRDKDGQLRPVIYVKDVFLDASGQVAGMVGAFLDITERKRMEDLLRIKEWAIAGSINGIALSDLSGNLTFVNPAFLSMWGYEDETDVLGRNSIEFWQERDEASRVVQNIQKHGCWRGELLGERRDGSCFVVEVAASQVTDEAGQPLCLLGVFADITERKFAEESLRESEKRFRILFEHAGVGVAQIDSNTGQFMQVNQKYCEIVGFTREEMLRLDFQTITHPDDLQTDLGLMERLKRGEIPEFTLEKRYFRKDGSVVWVTLIVSPLWNPDEAPSTHIAVVHDITKRKRAEQELRESEKRFRVLFENAGVGVAQGETNTGRFLKVNQKYCDIVGYTRHEMESLDFPSITYPDDLQANLDLLEQLKRGEIHEFTMEKRYIRKDGSLVWVLLTVSPLWNPGEPPSTHITVVHDITEQKRAEYALRYNEAELRKLNAELERRVSERTSQLELANRELEAFAYSVSHDLRAPLRAIDGFSRIIINEHADELSPAARELFERVRSANENMSQLVDALLGLSRMTRTAMYREPVDLGQLARAISIALTQSNPERTVEFVIVEHAVVNGDPRLLRVTMENLLENAWKFTSKQAQARIEFGIETRTGEPIYFVRDNGAGFNPRYADKLFGAFQRLHSANEFEGTGIGLATVQRIIHRHGGRIWAESELGKGATFYFTLGEARAS